MNNTNARKAPNACMQCETLLFHCGMDKLSVAQAQFVRAHLSTCVECSAMRDVDRVMAFDGTHSPARVLEEGTRQRMIGSIIERAIAKPIGSRGMSERRVRLRWLIPASAAVAISIVAFVSLNDVTRRSASSEDQRREPRSVAHVHGVAKVDNGTQITGTVVLVSGRQKPSQMISDVRSVAGGRRIRTGDEQTIFALKQGISVTVEAHSDLTLVRSNATDVKLSLRSGTVFVQKLPDSTECKLTIHTATSDVTVIGTVLRVQVVEGRTRVSVLRGKVSIVRTGDGHDELHVARGQAVWTDTQQIVAMNANETKRDGVALRTQMLLTEVNPARLVLTHDNKTTMTATLDGSVLGTLPLTAHVKPGTRTLVVYKNSQMIARETVVLQAQETLNRVYGSVETTDLSDEAKPKSETVAMTVHRRADGRIARRTPHRLTVQRDARHTTAAASEVAPTAQALLHHAQTLRAARDWVNAARVYRQLIQKFNKARETRAALVSLGEIQLDHLSDAKGALSSFTAYLNTTKRGSLKQEALYNSARALRALGKKHQEIQTLQRFLREFPAAIQAKQARSRLKVLRGN